MIALVVLAAIIGGIVYGVTRAAGHRGPTSPGTAAPPWAPGAPTPAGPAVRAATGAGGAPTALPPPPPTAALAEALARWQEAGLISGDQASAILAHEEAALAEAHAAWVAEHPPPPPVRPRRVPVVAEALGYLGGALAIAGLGLVLSRFWPDWSVGARLALSGVTAALLTAGGFAVRDQSEPALVRLRSVLWLAGTAGVGLFAGVLVRDGFGEPEANRVALGVALAVALHSGALWRGAVDRAPQELVCLAAAVVVVGTSVAQFGTQGAAGLAVLLTGVALLALGLRRKIPEHVLPELVGGVAAPMGALLMSDRWTAAGLLLCLVVALGLLAVATVPGLAPDRSDRIVTGAIGGVVLFQAAPSTLGYFAQDAGLATGLVAWALGAGLLALGARRLVLVPHLATAAGAAAMLVGAAVTGAQSPSFATIFGILTALGLVALGMLPGQVLLSVFGSVGLLGFVPWAISWFFPGEGRVPILILVSGVLILAIAVLLARLGPRFRHDLSGPPPPPQPTS